MKRKLGDIYVKVKFRISAGRGVISFFILDTLALATIILKLYNVPIYWLIPLTIGAFIALFFLGDFYLKKIMKKEMAYATFINPYYEELILEIKKIKKKVDELCQK